ncbi:MAG: hypothetical protein LUD74_02770, partial [Tannerellaceae bacterium]|nr:hypothetical protein [Tannerellaceae bacterium]
TCTDHSIPSPEPGDTGGNSDGNTSDDEIANTIGEISVFLSESGITTRAAWEYDDYFPKTNIYSDDCKLERRMHNLSVIYFDSDMLLEYFVDYINYKNDGMISIDNYENYQESDGKNPYTAIMLGMTVLGVKAPLTTGAHYFYVLANMPQNYIDLLQEFAEQRRNEFTKDAFEKIIVNCTIDELAGIPAFNIKENGDTIFHRRCFMSNITSPAPHYMVDRTQDHGSGTFPKANSIDLDIGKAFAKVALAYIPESDHGTLTEVQYRLANDPKQMYMLSNIFGGQVYTPHYSKAVDGYGNFEAYYDDNFNPQSYWLSEPDFDVDYYDHAVSFGWMKASTPEYKTFGYCMENANEVPLQGNSTMVLVRGKYNPTEWLNADNTVGTASEDGTFWRIWNSSTERYLSGYFNAEPLVSSPLETRKYTEGITYYPIWLETDGKYMVKRNNFYKIVIREVLNAGENSLENLIIPERALLESPLTESVTRNSVAGNNLPEATKSIRWEQSN